MGGTVGCNRRGGARVTVGMVGLAGQSKAKEDAASGFSVHREERRVYKSRWGARVIKKEIAMAAEFMRDGGSDEVWFKSDEASISPARDDRKLHFGVSRRQKSVSTRDFASANSARVGQEVYSKCIQSPLQHTDMSRSHIPSLK